MAENPPPVTTFSKNLIWRKNHKAGNTAPNQLHGGKGVWPGSKLAILGERHGPALILPVGLGILATGRCGSINYHCFPAA